MISDEELNKFRVEGLKVRVVRDAERDNDVRGLVVAWNDDKVMIRKPNRRVVELKRSYFYQLASEERIVPE